MKDRDVASTWSSVWWWATSTFVIVAAAVWVLYPHGGITVAVVSGAAASAVFTVTIAVWLLAVWMRDRSQ